MREQEWLTSTDSQKMLGYLLGEQFIAKEGEFQGGLVARWSPESLSERKLRLFACACARQVWPLLTDERSRRAVEVAERLADWQATKQEQAKAGLDAMGAYIAIGPDSIGVPPSDWGPYRRATAASWCLPDKETPAFRAKQVCNWLSEDLSSAVQADLLREVFGNPFRRPSCGWTVVRAARDMSAAALESGANQELVWYGNWLITPQVLSLAQAAYDGRLPDATLGPVRLAVLADALDDAGCTDAVLLQHLRGWEPSAWPPTEWRWRQETPHVRGCWALDLILGK